MAAWEDRLEAELELGRQSQVIGELESLVAKHPLRERPVGLLMLALYRGGRQADALDAYRRARETLVEELGIDPSPSCSASSRRSFATTRSWIFPRLRASACRR